MMTIVQLCLETRKFTTNYLLPSDILNLLKSDRSGPSDALRAFLPAVVLLEVLAVLPPPLALGEEGLERD